MVVRRISLSIAAALLAAAPLPAAATSAAPAAAQEAGECVLQGTGAISPGLGVVPEPQSYTLSGLSVCVGLATSGTFAANMACSSDFVVTCLALGDITISSSPIGACSGLMMHIGLYYFFECTGSGPLGVRGGFVITPQPPGIPITRFTFTGECSLLDL